MRFLEVPAFGLECGQCLVESCSREFHTPVLQGADGRKRRYWACPREYDQVRSDNALQTARSLHRLNQGVEGFVGIATIRVDARLAENHSPTTTAHHALAHYGGGLEVLAQDIEDFGHRDVSEFLGRSQFKCLGRKFAGGAEGIDILLIACEFAQVDVRQQEVIIGRSRFGLQKANTLSLQLRESFVVGNP
ncbi:MAG: hypothetical protein EBT50_02895, partial [Verrucomicrobia bacterium]|nr:hypothetical protein [Verrucomicrobiota bacterium]